jgi:hypothetical protein
VQDKLAWTAELYVLGELPDAEAEQFERRLLDDQSAREAVAAAVGLIQSLSDIEPTMAPRPRRFPIAWVGAAAAICVVLAVAVLSTPRNNEFVKATHPRAIVDADEWILAWPQVLQDQAAMNEFDDQPAAAEDSSVLISTTADGEDELPAWLIIATSGKEGSS